MVEAFDENSEKNDNIIEFIKLLPDTRTKYFATMTLYEEMQLSDNFELAGKAFGILQDLQNATDFGYFSEYDQRNVNITLKSLKRANCRDALQERRLFDTLKELLLLTVDIDKNIKEIFKYAAMIKGMEDTLLDENRDIFYSIKNLIPKTITYLVWKETVCIMKPGTGYMYVEEFGNILSGSKSDVKVFLLSNGSKPSTGYEWVFESDDYGESFYIKNVKLGQYMYVADEYMDEGDSSFNKLLFKWAKTSSLADKWKIQLDQKGTILLITNPAYNRGSVRKAET